MTKQDHDAPAGAIPGQGLGGAGPESREELRERMARAAARSGDFVRQQAQAVDARVRRQPWPMLATAFVAGVLFGYILSRRR